MLWWEILLIGGVVIVGLVGFSVFVGKCMSFGMGTNERRTGD